MHFGTEACVRQVDSSCQASTAMGVGEDLPGRTTSPTTPTHYLHKLQDVDEERHHHRPQRPQLLEQQLQQAAPEPSRSGMSTLHYVLTTAPSVSVATSQPVLNVPSSGKCVCVCVCLLVLLLIGSLTRR